MLGGTRHTPQEFADTNTYSSMDDTTDTDEDTEMAHTPARPPLPDNAVHMSKCLEMVKEAWRKRDTARATCKKHLAQIAKMNAEDALRAGKNKAAQHGILPSEHEMFLSLLRENKRLLEEAYKAKDEVKQIIAIREAPDRFQRHPMTAPLEGPE